MLGSSLVGYDYGVAGPFWFAAGCSPMIVFFSLLGISCKLKIPEAHTLLEIVRIRYGTYSIVRRRSSVYTDWWRYNCAYCVHVSVPHQQHHRRCKHASGRLRSHHCPVSLPCFLPWFLVLMGLKDRNPYYCCDISSPARCSFVYLRRWDQSDVSELRMWEDLC